MVPRCHSSCQAAPSVSSDAGRYAGSLLDPVEVEGVAILVGQRMVISENQEEHVLVVEESENVVVDGGSMGRRPQKRSRWDRRFIEQLREKPCG